MKKNIIKADKRTTQKVHQASSIQNVSKEEVRQQIDSLVKLLFKDYRPTG